MPTRTGGRPRQIDEQDIVRAGRDLGMRELSLNAVAARLGVSSTALYRHVDGRWGLERLVGESLLADLELPDDPDHDLLRHLVSFGIRLRAFVLAHPGLASYLQTLFPRGASGRRLLADEVDALVRRGYAPAAAVVVSNAVASLAIGFAATEETRSLRAGDLPEREREVLSDIESDERLADAHRGVPVVDPAEFARLMLTATLRGLLDVAPPGRPVAQFVAELSAVSEGV